jgi:hypothetical protein
MCIDTEVPVGIGTRWWNVRTERFAAAQMHRQQLECMLCMLSAAVVDDVEIQILRKRCGDASKWT